jgi:hypothetical protein
MFYDFKKTHNRGFDDLRRRNQKRWLISIKGGHHYVR